MAEKKLAKSRVLAAKVVYAALQALKDKGGELPSSEVVSEVGRRVNFDDWEKSQYEKTGYIRWQSMLHFLVSTAKRQAF